MRGGLRVALVALVGASAGCEGCKRADPAPEGDPYAAPLAAPLGAAPVVKESLPRCRAEGARLSIPGDEVVTGDTAVTSDALLVGVVRREGTKRLASVMRASLDLSSVKVLDVGSALGDDPPPSPRLRGGVAFVASYARGKTGPAAQADGGAEATAGSMGRVLEIARIDGTALVSEGRVVQQADESLAFDVAWPEGDQGTPLVAWDEDAPPRAGTMLADRGVVKVQRLGGDKPHVVSPENTDAEAPRLLARRGGYWLAWLARRPEAGEDAGAEGPGEPRAYRWVEVVALDPKGEVTSPVRRVSPEKGHVASFDLASTGLDAQLVVVVQDETAQTEGAGERVVRYAIEGDRTESGDLLDGGVGHALAEVLATQAAPRWLAFTDIQEHAHLVPLGPALELAGAATTEPSLDGARIVASAPPDLVFAVGTTGPKDSAGRPELRRLVCR